MCERLCATKLCVCDKVVFERDDSLAAWMSPSAMPATQSDGPRCQVPRLPRKVTVHVAKCHACPLSATPAAQSDGPCRQVPRLPRKVTVHVAKCHACPLSATSAAQSDGPCRQVPRARRKAEADVAKCHACHANSRGAHGANRATRASPVPYQDGLISNISGTGIIEAWALSWKMLVWHRYDNDAGAMSPLGQRHRQHSVAGAKLWSFARMSKQRSSCWDPKFASQNGPPAPDRQRPTPATVRKSGKGNFQKHK